MCAFAGLVVRRSASDAADSMWMKGPKVAFVRARQSAAVKQAHKPLHGIQAGKYTLSTSIANQLVVSTLPQIDLISWSQETPLQRPPADGSLQKESHLGELPQREYHMWYPSTFERIQSVLIRLPVIPPSFSGPRPPWPALALSSAQTKWKVYIRGSLCRSATAELPLHVYFLCIAQHVQLARLRHSIATGS